MPDRTDPRYLALIVLDPYQKHGQLCPVWVQRRRGSIECTCWRANEVLALLAIADSHDPLRQKENCG